MTVKISARRELPEGNPSTVAHQALRLLQFETEIREQGGVDALFFHLVNQLRTLVSYEQALLLRRPRLGRQLRGVMMCDLPVVDRGTPLVKALEQRVRLLDHPTQAQEIEIRVEGLDSLSRAALNELPCPHAFWLPLVRQEMPLSAGILLLREQEFSLEEKTLLQRLGADYAHAWRALDYHRHAWKLGPLRWWGVGVGASVLLLSLIPVRMSVMAPVEVVAERPFLLTAPFNGVVREILVAPNTSVTAGTPLLQFEDIEARNEQILARQELEVARARLERISASAFADAGAMRELAIVKAEYALAEVRFRYATEVLARTLIRAPRAGLVVYTDRRDWEGRAVSVGEQILQVADPAQVAYRVALPVGNAVELQAGAPASIYLDGTPLGGGRGHIRTLSYAPSVTAEGVVSYTIMVDADEGAVAARIGARGTARLYGDRVVLIWQLLRRPLNGLRQWLGV